MAQVERPVTALISSLEQPASASIRAAVLRRPCSTQASGSLASSMLQQTTRQTRFHQTPYPVNVVSRLMCFAVAARQLRPELAVFRKMHLSVCLALFDAEQSALAIRRRH